MPVDFTKDTKKTNYQYLLEAIKDNTEALEFLEAFDADYKKLLEQKNDEIKELQDEIDNTPEEDAVEYHNEVDLGFGMKDSLKWSAGNLALTSMMEELENCFARNLTPIQIESALRAL